MLTDTVILETTKFPLPLINVGRLSTKLSPANVAYQFSMGRPFSTLEISTLKGGGGGWRGEERARSCTRFQNSLEKSFQMVSFRIMGKNDEINFCFVQQPLQSAVYI